MAWQQTIIGTNDGLIFWHMYGPRGTLYVDKVSPTILITRQFLIHMFDIKPKKNYNIFFEAQINKWINKNSPHGKYSGAYRVAFCATQGWLRGMNGLCSSIDLN